MQNQTSKIITPLISQIQSEKKTSLAPDKNTSQRKKQQQKLKQTTTQTMCKHVRNLRMQHRSKPVNGDNKLFAKNETPIEIF